MRQQTDLQGKFISSTHSCALPTHSPDGSGHAQGAGGRLGYLREKHACCCLGGWPAGRSGRTQKPQVASFTLGTAPSYPGTAGRAYTEAPLPPEPACLVSPPGQGPRGGADPRELHACPMLSSVSAPRRPGSGLHHAASSTPARLPAPRKHAHFASPSCPCSCSLC